MPETVQLLAQRGFRKRTGDIFTLDVSEDVLGWLGLNRASKHHAAGEVEINPVVGVRHQGVERIVAELRGEKFHEYVPPTISTPIGYLMPEHCYRAWIFRGLDEGDEGAKMVAAVTASALPFMRRMAELTEICGELDRGLGYEHQIIYRRRIAWMLLGDDERAHKVLAESLAKVSPRNDPAALEFRRFAEALERRLERSTARA